MQGATVVPQRSTKESGYSFIKLNVLSRYREQATRCATSTGFSRPCSFNVRVVVRDAVQRQQTKNIKFTVFPLASRTTMCVRGI